MNCRQFQESIFARADGSLPAGVRADMERHQTNCPACRGVIQRHEQLASSLSELFRRETESLVLSAEQQHRLVSTLQHAHEPAETSVFESWWRIAWIGGAVAATVVAVLLVVASFSRHRPGPVKGEVMLNPVVIRTLHCAPTYTFRREEDFVTDSISCNPLLIEGTLWLAESQKRPPQNSIVP